MGQMNLIPFMNFPDVALNLHNVTYYEKEIHRDSLYQEPILSLDEIYITLDVFDLIRGDITIAQARLQEGFIRIEIYEDSLSNLENALGIRFGEGTEKDSVEGLPTMKVDLDRLRISNIFAVMHDHTNGNELSIQINQLESRFSYLPENIEAAIKLDIDVNSLKHLTFNLETSKNILFESDVSVDPQLELVQISPSKLEFSGLEMETWGSFGYSDKRELDLKFKASNTGLDLLNFLFRGILDLDEIEQIGSGSIHLDGDIKGVLRETLPVIRINGSAEDIGFRIKSLQKDVTDISFNMHATNGKKPDLSEGVIHMEKFTASFPEGTINANITVSNMVTPELDVEISGLINLDGMEQMIKYDALSGLQGQIALDGRLNGRVNRDSVEFLNEAGTLSVLIEDGGFILDQDTVKSISGEIFVEENIIGTNSLELDFNGNKVDLNVHVQDLLLYLLDFDCDVRAEVSLASEVLYPASFISDTAVAKLLGDELRGLHFSAGAVVSAQDLDAFIKNDSIPTVHLSLDSFGIELPVYADISDMNASLTIGPDSVALHYLSGTIGESGFIFSGLVSNYDALSTQDSGEVVSVTYDLKSDLMRAEDFFTFNGGFMLPETYQTEYLEDFRLAGTFEAPVYGLLHDSVPMDFGLSIKDLGWKFRYYPLEFKQFLVQLRKKGDRLIIDDFRGEIGESNLKMTATLENINDTARENIYGSLVLESNLLDFNELLNYQLPEEMKDSSLIDTTEVREPPRLDQINYPDFDFTLNLGEVRYGNYKVFGMKGKLRSSTNRILYLDQLITSTESGGSIEFNGQFNVSNPYYYTFSADLDINNVDINDLAFEMQSGDSVYTLNENFQGIVSADGLAEIFITPDLKIDMSTTTAMFNMRVVDGALIEFTPLQAAAKFLDNKDLNHVRFAMLRNSFTLIDSRIIVPLMNVESTAGQLLIEGEQGLDNSYLYLVRVPVWLVKGAAKSVLSNAGDDQEEDQIQTMKMGKFLPLTVWSDGVESGVRIKDKREKYLE